MSTIKANNVTAVDANTDLALTGNGTGTVNLPTGFKVNNVANSFLSSATNVTVAQGGTGASTFAANGILFGNGTSAIGATAVGTSAQVLTSNGSGVAPTFQDAAGGAWTLASSGTFAAVSTLDFTGLTGTTRWFITGLYADLARSVRMLTSTDNGVSFDNSAGNYDYIHRQGFSSSSSEQYSKSTSSTDMRTETLSNLAAYPSQFEVTLWEPQKATRTLMSGHAVMLNSSGNSGYCDFSGTRLDSAGLVDAFRFKPNAGNFTGSYQMWELN